MPAEILNLLVGRDDGIVRKKGTKKGTFIFSPRSGYRVRIEGHAPLTAA